MDFDKTIKEISDLTYYNNHIEAKILGCRLIGKPADKIRKRFEAIKTLMEMDGHLDHYLHEYQFKWSQNLYVIASIHLTAEQYDQFHSAY